MTNSIYVSLIDDLRSKRKEGSYWDFKQEWPNEIKDLIKDIICFTNTSHHHDCYLIYGISDSHEVIGLDESSKTYEQSDILDTLSKLNFAGDILPEIELEKIEYYSKRVDILIVKNQRNTPVFLKQTYGKMLKGCIYSRQGDKNTEDNGNSDIQTIQQLWKKRFGLTRPTLEYFYERLENKEEWCGADSFFYNIYRPEFTIKIEDDEHGKDEFYFYSMINEQGSFDNLKMVYRGIVLDEYQIAIMDSGNIRVPIPEWGRIGTDHGRREDLISYKYYIKESTRFDILNFLYDPLNPEQAYAFKNLMDVVLIYDSDSQKDQFEEYALGRKQDIEEAIAKEDSYNYIIANTDIVTDLYKKRLRTGKVLVEEFVKWKNSSKLPNHHSKINS